MRAREEHRAAQNVIGARRESYRRLLAREHRTTHIHLSNAPGARFRASPLPPAGTTGGRLSEVSGGPFGHLGEPSPPSVEDPDHTV